MAIDIDEVFGPPSLTVSFKILKMAVGQGKLRIVDRLLAEDPALDPVEGLALSRAYGRITSRETRQAILDVVAAVEANQRF